MRIRRNTVIILVFAFVFVAANLVALPFANFGGFSALWAQVYGTTNSIPSCTGGSSEFSRLSDADAEAVSAPFTPPTADAELAAVFMSSCFGLNSVALNDFAEAELTCDNVVAYRIEANGNRELWPVSCDDSGESLLIPGTGEQGHIQLFKVADPASAPAGVALSRGA